MGIQVHGDLFLQGSSPQIDIFDTDIAQPIQTKHHQNMPGAFRSGNLEGASFLAGLQRDPIAGFIGDPFLFLVQHAPRHNCLIVAGSTP